ncbi:MAG TPA: hypothetical protein VJU84_05430 [Pyrinomonadaceae bacterium]|nr:hypothetical protein [Pyrinomonadaceae bacterium]
MKRLNLLLLVFGLSTSLAYSQTLVKPDRDGDLQKLALLSEVKTLAIEIPKLDGPLARALAKAEIADAAWTLDREWAKRMLKEAYQFTYPTDEEQSKFQPEPTGAASKPPTIIGTARMNVRRRILSVARRDRVFADQLILDSSPHVTKDDRQMMYAQLASFALDEGNYEMAGRAIEQSMGVDPTQITFVTLVNDLAIKDRAAADKLILHCMASLSAVQLSGRRLSTPRALLTVMWLVFPNSIFPDPNKRIPDPGPAVMKTYVSYTIESLGALEQVEPGSLKRARGILLSAWLPLNAYAPDLKEAFMQLEALSRTPGKDASLPTQSNADKDKETFRKRDSEALNSNEPNDLSIRSLISREEFDTARKLIGKLPDGPRKTEFIEQVNTKEAISLGKKGDLLGAGTLAERLSRTGSMLEVYPLIVQGYAANKDQIGASAAVHQAVRQLKNADTKPASMPYSSGTTGIPASFAGSFSTIDPVLSSLGKLAKAVVAVDSLLAAEVVDEMVERANGSQMDTKLGGSGIDNEVFTQLAAKDEVRARTAAENLKDRLRRIVALAGIYQWKAKELETANQEKTIRTHGSLRDKP